MSTSEHSLHGKLYFGIAETFFKQIYAKCTRSLNYRNYEEDKKLPI